MLSVFAAVVVEATQLAKGYLYTPCTDLLDLLHCFRRPGAKRCQHVCVLHAAWQSVAVCFGWHGGICAGFWCSCRQGHCRAVQLVRPGHDSNSILRIQQHDALSRLGGAAAMLRGCSFHGKQPNRSHVLWTIACAAVAY